MDLPRGGKRIYIKNVKNTMYYRYSVIKDEDRVWIIGYSNAQMMSVTDVINKLEVAFQGDEADEPLDMLDELGHNTDFLDWFYNMELDNAFAPASEDQIKSTCDLAGEDYFDLLTEILGDGV